VVLRDVSLIDVDAFSGAVSKNLVDGVRFDLRNLMVGISIAKVVACGVHVVLMFFCCWRDDVIVFVLIFEFSSDDGGDFHVFRLVVVLVA